MIRIMILIVLLCSLGCSSKNNKLSNQERTRKAASDQIRMFVETGDTTHLRTVFSSALLEQLSVEGMTAIRADLIDQHGSIEGIEGPFVDSTSEVRLSITFEKKVLDVWLTFDSNQTVSWVDITNAPMNDSQRQDRVAPLTDTALNNLTAIDDFAQRFNADTGFVRLISLLSPT